MSAIRSRRALRLADPGAAPLAAHAPASYGVLLMRLSSHGKR